MNDKTTRFLEVCLGLFMLSGTIFLIVLTFSLVNKA